MNGSVEMEKVLVEGNLRKTKARKLILAIMQDSLPKTAAEIYAAVKESNGPFSLSTIYRACVTMANKGILLKSNLTGDSVTRYEYPKAEHIHHAICLCCHRIFPIGDCPFGQFDELMHSKYDFDVKSHRIEIYGYCHDCLQALKNKSSETIKPKVDSGN